MIRERQPSSSILLNLTTNAIRINLQALSKDKACTLVELRTTLEQENMEC
jgi:hypothetical protein